ncbi:MAG: hypothetical protein J7L28_03825 [Thermotogae bacterium]|nr:hypothetical protein [Thermotogota bacterium]
MSMVKERLIHIIQRLLEEIEDILLQYELESDPETLKALREAKKGENLIPHEEAMKLLGL